MSRGDKQFLQDAAELALGEIELGKLAQSNGSSLDVKQLGNKLIADHTKSLNELKAIATAKSRTRLEADIPAKRVAFGFREEVGPGVRQGIS